MKANPLHEMVVDIQAKISEATSRLASEINSAIISAMADAKPKDCQWIIQEGKEGKILNINGRNVLWIGDVKTSFEGGIFKISQDIQRL